MFKPSRTIPITPWRAESTWSLGSGKSDSGGRRDFWEYSQILESVTKNTVSVLLNIFPNPTIASSIIKIGGNEAFYYKQLHYILYDLAGSKIAENFIEDNKIALPSNTKNGIYLIVIKNNNQIVNSTKLNLL